MSDGGRRQRPADDQSAVLAFLRRPDSYRPPVASVERIDTHSASVFLAGDHAYKIKRAVVYPFLDFSTLEKRHAACLNELAVNRRSAACLYQGVVPITRDAGGKLTLDGLGETVEWAVKMRRFEQSALYDRMAEAGRLPIDRMPALADAIHRLHAVAARRLDREGAVEAMRRLLRENEAAMAARPDIYPPDAARAFAQACRERLDALAPMLRERALGGYVRHCHGDLHLRNIVEHDGRPVLFDALEFDDAIATVDVLDDLAFLLMDLWFRGLEEHANAVMNRYLSRVHPADLRGLAALPFYMATRAMIRSKAEALRVGGEAGAARDEAEDRARAYFALSRTLLAPTSPRIVAIGGLSGTGKSTLARALSSRFEPAPGAVHLRSDVERKRLYGVEETERLPASAYAIRMTDRVYASLRRKTVVAGGAGLSVVVDAVHARPDERAAVAEAAAAMGVAFAAIWLTASEQTLIDRVARRQGDASDADAGVVRAQLAHDVGRIDWKAMPADRPLAQTIADSARYLGLPAERGRA